MDDGTAERRACKVCGDPLRRDNTIGICTSRSRPECRTAYGNAQYERHSLGDGLPPKYCETCGGRLSPNNTIGICTDRGKRACYSEYLRRRDRKSRAVPASAREACAVCGGKLRADNKAGVCRRTPECRRELKRVRRRQARDRAAARRQPAEPASRPRRVPAIPAGTVFGRWTTLEESAKGSTTVLCRCRCPLGTERQVPIGNLKRGLSKSCGCLRRENQGRPKGNRQGPYLAAGWVCGQLLTLEDAPMSYTEVLVRCTCGQPDARKNAQRLKAGLIASCGCLPKQTSRTHGLSGHPLYGIWSGIVRRGSRPGDRDYWKYGAIGRTVCEGYRGCPDGLLRYAADMGPRPSLDHSTDRLDNNGGYWCGRCPECLRNGWPFNVGWRTISEQNQNRDCVTKVVALTAEVKRLSRAGASRPRKPEPSGRGALF